jgi:hypothetical protein
MMKLSNCKKAARMALAGVVLMALVSACEYDYVDFPEPVPSEIEVKFSTDIIPIFVSSCNSSSCHATGAVPPDLTPANAYNSLMELNQVDTANPANSILYKKMSTGSMATFSTAAQAQAVFDWISQGAKNN